VPFRYQLSEDGVAVLIQEFDHYRGNIYKFSLTLALVEDGADVHIERVDSCDDQVHRHRFCRSGANGDRIRICDYEPGDHTLIEREMDRALEDYTNSWPQRIRDWEAR
jgi:hypothetical protein